MPIARINRFSFLIVLFVAIQSGLFSLSAQVKDKGIPSIFNYSKQDYNGGTQNWDFVQAGNRVLYVANNQGILKFDGLKWGIIPMPNRSVVRCLYIDENETIFAGAYNEFGYLAPDSIGKLEYISLAENIPDSKPGEFWKICRQDDYYYFQSYQALVIFNKATDSWQTIEPDQQFGFLQQVDGHLYINSRGVGLMQIDQSQLTSVPGGEFLADYEVWKMAEVNGKLLIGTQNHGVFVLDGVQGLPWNTPVNEFLLENKLFSFEQTEDNLFWGSIQDGLVVSDNKGNIITHLNKETGLANNTVLSLFIDAEQNLWMGLDKGIDQIFIHSPISNLLTTDDIGAGYAVVLFKEKIYLGTNQGLFWIPADMGKASFTQIPIARRIPELSGQVWSLMVYCDELLVGHNRGTFAIREGQVRQVYDQSGGWNFITIPGDTEHILQGTYNGMVVYKQGPQGIQFDFKIDGIEESCRTLLITADKNIWMGHGYLGIYNIDLSQDLREVKNVKLFGISSGLGTNNFNELFQIGKEILVANSDGFFMYDSEIEDFIPAVFWNRNFQEGGRFTKLIHQKQNNYFYFQEKTGGFLQIFSDTLFIKDKKILAPIARSFIPSFENISFIGDEELLIGTDNGFVHLDMNMAMDDHQKPPFHFNSLSSLRNQSSFKVKLEYQNDLSRKHPGHPLNNIPYRDNDLRISFVSSFLTDPKQTEYQYIFDGLTDSWSPWSGMNTVDFTNLREGEYLFRVKARNVFGAITSENQLYFHIRTPWHRSVVAYISYFLLFTMGLYISWKVINTKLEREKRRSKIMEERRMLHKQLKLKRESELAEKEIEKLRNDKLRADIRHKSKELANQTMGIIQKNRFLTEIKEEMLFMKKKAQSEDVKNTLRRMLRKIDWNIEDKNSQKVFEMNFDQVHENFILRMKNAYPDLTAKDLRMCAYLRLNLSTKEIAPLLNISVRGVEISRYRLRKKLILDHNENLADYILRF